jgi:potassium-transporting ATPase potassium-binding subunit
MNPNLYFLKPIAECAFFIALILIAAKPVGLYLYSSLSGSPSSLTSTLRPLERLFQRAAGGRFLEEQGWAQYGKSLLVFNALGIGVLLLLELIQKWLPLNPQRLGNVPLDLAFNTAVSFGTNTNWQSYVPERTMSYLTQMLGLAVQNFLSAATGIAVALALIRGFIRKEAKSIGNFWVDLSRSIVYVLLPLSLLFSILLLWQGAPQNFKPAVEATTLEGKTQVIPQGPVASQEAIKELGTNGGGFFNANSSHPYENPTPLTNLLELLAIVLIPAGLIYAFGKMTGDIRQGRALMKAVLVLFAAGLAIVVFSEWRGNSLIQKEFSGIVETGHSQHQPGGNLEGKEERFGIAASSLFTTATTATSCGAVNNMHSSLAPMSGFVALFNMQLGEIVFGGVGSGLYMLILFAVVTVFIAGLMVGRTPEYLGKKIGPLEIKLTVLAVLISSIMILVVAAAGSLVAGAKASVGNSGPHGFSEILYAGTSAAANNGSAFASLNANTLFWNISLALAMLVGRYVPIILTLRLAGALAQRRFTAVTSGSFPTTGWTFVLLLVAIIILVGGLTFMPALTLGPVVEHLMMLSGSVF